MADSGQPSSLEWLRLCQTKGTSLAGPGGRSDLEIMLMELKRHKKRKDAWICIEGKI